jgi:DnaJ-class molecular chaperone
MNTEQDIPEDDNEPGICPACNGSGEGQHEDTRCYLCKGKGEV